MKSPNTPIKISDNLYLGNFSAAEYENLQQHNISAVVCLTNDSHNYSDDIDLFHIDDISENLDIDTFDLEKLNSAIDFIENKIKQNHNVLVHCMAGSSRSPTVVIAYIIKCKNLSVNEACNYVRSKAEHINPTFMDLLDQYYYSLK